jgi:glycine oxidase
MYDLIIVGGGIVGLTVLKEAIQNQLKVLLIDAQEVGKNTSYAAAGMLAPINELEHGEEELLFAGIKSVPLYLEYERVLGDIGLSQKGTLEIALTSQDAQYLKREWEYRQNLGLKVQWLNKNELLEKEPFLSPNIYGGIYTDSEWQIDNRLLLQKLKSWALLQGAEIQEFQKIIDWGFHRTHLSVSSGQHTWQSQNIIFCMGYLPEEIFPLPYVVYPIKGQMLSVKPNPQYLSLEHVIRFKTRTLGNGYIVPKKDRIILGATNEEMGNDTTVTAGGIMDILRKCYAAVPAIYDLEILETWVGLRPSSQDRHPFILKAHQKNVFYMNGFYRNGFCLSPLFAKNFIKILKNQSIDPEIQPFIKFL